MGRVLTSQECTHPKKKVMEMSMLGCMYGRRRDKIWNEVIQVKVGVVFVENKIRKTRLRSFRHVKRKCTDAPNKTVSIFETTIRILGGLISAHLIASDHNTGMRIPSYDDELLHLAEDLARRMLPAFDTPTGRRFEPQQGHWRHYKPAASLGPRGTNRGGPALKQRDPVGTASRVRKATPGNHAYDHVNWEFLDFMMLKMGSGEKWRRWIKFYISTARFFVVVNAEDIRKNHLVNWRVVIFPLRWGGLGVKDLKVFNKALLGRCIWRFGVEENDFWSGVVAEKYGMVAEGLGTLKLCKVGPIEAEEMLKGMERCPISNHITSTAGGGTLTLEFGILSRLTNDPSNSCSFSLGTYAYSCYNENAVFEQVAKNAVRGLWARRSKINLVGAHIDVFSGGTHCSRLMAGIKASNYDDRVSLLLSLTSLDLGIVESQERCQYLGRRSFNSYSCPLEMIFQVSFLFCFNPPPASLTYFLHHPSGGVTPELEYSTIRIGGS
ncbi:hypothetical protein MTR67_027549 [Solanum verrucosum]|uniref:Alpha-1,2-Mannosidase n=1 Tax=Solanum verrucosum TaxID=315347 RepID=A0AAF0TVT2_SOLVR|nr:hypothetical protein MTR67_027549 [Solanum verrucosum]